MRSGLLKAILLICGMALCVPLQAERVVQIAAAKTAPGGERRTALVIGNSAYKSAPLRNPANDARAIAGSLSNAGFAVTVLEDGTRSGMNRAIRAFGDELARGGVGLFYFAGHGMQVRGRNFLVPVDAEIEREYEVEYQSLDANVVLSMMDSARNSCSPSPSVTSSGVLDVHAVSSSGVRDQLQRAVVANLEFVHQPGAYLVGVAPGIASFSPYLRAFQELREGDLWLTVQYQNFPACHSTPNTFCEVKARVAGKEKVSVKAGTFDAWKIVVELAVRAGSDVYASSEFSYWFADEPRRFVKYQSRKKIEGWWGQPDVDMDLVSYVRGKTSPGASGAPGIRTEHRR